MAGFLSARRLALRGVGEGVAPLETGLLPAYRGLVLYWLLYWLFVSPTVRLVTGSPGVLAPWQYAALIGVQAAALTLLFWRAARARLGRAFLPLVLVTTTLPFFVEKAWFLRLGTAPDATQGELLHAFAVRQDFALLLLIIAWQYRFRYAALYVLMISVGEWLLVSRADTPDHLGSILNANMLFTRGVVYLLLGYLVTRLMRQQRQQRRALVQANAELSEHASTLEQLTLSRERNRLARELHDTLAHSLSALSVQLEATRTLWEHDPEAAKRMLAQADITTRSGFTEARRSLHALRASPLDVGLVGALRELAERTAERAGLALDLTLPDALRLAPTAEQGLYRIVQEALENVVRHAQATRLEMVLEQKSDRLRLDIKDDGVGFDLTKTTHEKVFGLRGIKERAALLGATLNLNSSPAGTSLSLDLER